MDVLWFVTIDPFIGPIALNAGIRPPIAYPKCKITFKMSLAQLEHNLFPTYCALHHGIEHNYISHIAYLSLRCLSIASVPTQYCKSESFWLFVHQFANIFSVHSMDSFPRTAPPSASQIAGSVDGAMATTFPLLSHLAFRLRSI